MRPKIGVVIPALNAAPTIAEVVTDALAYLPWVVVIDDGSTDGTLEAARAAGAETMRHERNRGKGGALKSGFFLALGERLEAVITLDADGQHRASEIPKFLAEWESSHPDLLIGSRDHLFAQMLRRRRLANQFSAWTISICAGTPVSDSQSGFRLYSSTLLERVSVRSNGFDFESEIIVRAGRGGYSVKSIPIELGFVNGISTSHYQPIRDTLKIAWTVGRTRFFG